MTAYPILWANNAVATLASSISNSQVTLTLTSGEGALFPSPSPGQFFSLTLISASNANLYEITYCTSRSGDTLTVQRGMEGTAALGWNAGDLAQNLLTAGQLAALPQLATQNEWQATQIFDVTAVLSEGVHSIGYDSGGANIRISNGTYGAFWRVDSANAYFLLTNSGSPYGSTNSLRPFSVGLSSGYVTIDGTGAGVSFGGNVGIIGSLQTAYIHSTGDAHIDGSAYILGNVSVSYTLAASTVQGAYVHSTGVAQVDSYARVNTGASGSGDSARVVNLGDFTNSVPTPENGWFELPDGTIFNIVTTTVSFSDTGPITTNLLLPKAYSSVTTYNVVACWGGITPPYNLGLAVDNGDTYYVKITTTAAPGTGSGSGQAVRIMAIGR